MAFKIFFCNRINFLSLNKFIEVPVPLSVPNRDRYFSRRVFPPAKFFSSGKDKGGNNGGNDKSKSEAQKPFRHNYPKALEGGVNHQILAELNASMVYLSMFCHYGKTHIAMPGCQHFFKKMYDEEQQHALEFIEYQLMRGGEVRLFPLTVPEDQDWIDITIALGISLELEKVVKEKLEELARLAECNNDRQLADFVTAKYLKEQNDSICEIGRLLTKAKRLVDTGEVGRQLFDKEVYLYMQEIYPEVKLPYKNI